MRGLVCALLALRCWGVQAGGQAGRQAGARACLLGSAVRCWYISDSPTANPLPCAPACLPACRPFGHDAARPGQHPQAHLLSAAIGAACVGAWRCPSLHAIPALTFASCRRRHPHAILLSEEPLPTGRCMHLCNIHEILTMEQQRRSCGCSSNQLQPLCFPGLLQLLCAGAAPVQPATDLRQDAPPPPLPP